MKSCSINNLEISFCRDVILNGNLCLVKKESFIEWEKISFLSYSERNRYNFLKADIKRHEYLLGRLAVKHSVAGLLKVDNLSEIIVESGVFNQPIVKFENPIPHCNIQVSLTHSDNIAASIAFPEEHPVGIDYQVLDEDLYMVVESQLTHYELDLYKKLSLSKGKVLNVIWTAKEAISKVMKTGLMTPLFIYEIEKIMVYSNKVISFFKNFPQYKAVSFIDEKKCLTVVIPRNSEMFLNIDNLIL
jgi:4'-phosphopantetheinyl transferase